jgi:hypothetical protein
MTSGLGRIYAIALATVVFFLAWAVIAARPWVETPDAKTDPRIAALDAREHRLRKDAIEIRAIVQKRWTVYRAELATRKHLIAARKKAEQALLAKQTLLASQTRVVQQAPQAPSSQPAPAPSAPIVRVAPASPPATHTKSS